MNMKYMKNIGGSEFRRAHTEPPKKVNLSAIPRQYRPKPKPIIPEIQPETLEKPRISLNINRWSVFGIIVVCAGLLALSVSNVINVNNMLKNNAIMKQKQNDIKQQNEILIKRINYLESPERITSIAREKFHMIVPQSVPKFVNQ